MADDASDGQKMTDVLPNVDAAQQALKMLYDKDQKLSKLFSGLTGGELVDKIFEVYAKPEHHDVSCTLPFFLGPLTDIIKEDDAGKEYIDSSAVRALSRHPVNVRKQRIQLIRYIRSIFSLGVTSGVRGLAWATVDMKRPGCFLLLSWGTLAEALYEAVKIDPYHPKLLAAVRKGIPNSTVISEPPVEVSRFLKSFHNMFHSGSSDTLVEFLEDTERHEADMKLAIGSNKEVSAQAGEGEAARQEQEWQWIDNNINKSGGKLKEKKYPSKQNWFDACALMHKLRSKLDWPLFKTFLENEADFTSLDTHKTVFALNRVASLLVSNAFKDRPSGKSAKPTIPPYGLQIIFLEVARFIIRQSGDENDEGADIPQEILPTVVVGSGRKVPLLFEGKSQTEVKNMIDVLKLTLKDSIVYQKWIESQKDAAPTGQPAADNQALPPKRRRRNAETAEFDRFDDLKMVVGTGEFERAVNVTEDMWRVSGSSFAEPPLLGASEEKRNKTLATMTSINLNWLWSGKNFVLNGKKYKTYSSFRPEIPGFVMRSQSDSSGLQTSIEVDIPQSLADAAGEALQVNVSFGAGANAKEEYLEELVAPDDFQKKLTEFLATNEPGMPYDMHPALNALISQMWKWVESAKADAVEKSIIFTGFALEHVLGQIYDLVAAQIDPDWLVVASLSLDIVREKSCLPNSVETIFQNHKTPDQLAQMRPYYVCKLVHAVSGFCRVYYESPSVSETQMDQRLLQQLNAELWQTRDGPGQNGADEVICSKKFFGGVLSSLDTARAMQAKPKDSKAALCDLYIALYAEVVKVIGNQTVSYENLDRVFDTLSLKYGPKPEVEPDDSKTPPDNLASDKSDTCKDKDALTKLGSDSGYVTIYDLLSFRCFESATKDKQEDAKMPGAARPSILGDHTEAQFDSDVIPKMLPQAGPFVALVSMAATTMLHSLSFFSDTAECTNSVITTNVFGDNLLFADSRDMGPSAETNDPMDVVELILSGTVSTTAGPNSYKLMSVFGVDFYVNKSYTDVCAEYFNAAWMVRVVNTEDSATMAVVAKSYDWFFNGELKCFEQISEGAEAKSSGFRVCVNILCLRLKAQHYGKECIELTRWSEEPRLRKGTGPSKGKKAKAAPKKGGKGRGGRKGGGGASAGPPTDSQTLEFDDVLIGPSAYIERFRETVEIGETQTRTRSDKNSKSDNPVINLAKHVYR